ncbi:MAG: chemotaxis protein CheW [Spirochaetales bacterium]|nr:chemotaxis protein CheW [Spirochaetales bacterium]
MDASTIKEYLIFTIEKELYALHIAKVLEVVEFTSITRVPKTPNYMRGVVNLRGDVVPVIDLKLKFGLSETEKNLDTSIIVMEIIIEGENIILGALADAVHEVITLEAGEIEPAPKIGSIIDAEYLIGIGKKDEQFLLILNMDKIISTKELAILESAKGHEKAISIKNSTPKEELK